MLFQGRGRPFVLGIVGTLPEEELGLLVGVPELRGEFIFVEGQGVPINRGTPALIAAAIKTCQFLDQGNPMVFLAGDTGRGKGSRDLYRYLTEHLGAFELDTITFHYLLPDVDWHNKVLFTIQGLSKRPLLIADAGYMYVAKMSGLAKEYDLFTPDVGELAFLGDELAPHPFYTRGFILHEDHKVEELIRRAYDYENASKWLLVKGTVDYVANETGIVAKVDDPCVEELEPIGGTGDTITGMVSVLLDGGMDMERACLLALKANRLAGQLSCPSPATQVFEIISRIPDALRSLSPF